MAPLARFSLTWVLFLALSLTDLNGAHYFTIGGHTGGTCLLEVSSGVKVSLANVPDKWWPVRICSHLLDPGDRGQEGCTEGNWHIPSGRGRV